MDKSPNMLSQVTPWDMVAEGYAETTMKLFRGYAEKAIELANLSPQQHILDVACGPGTLALLASEQVHAVQAIDFSPAMVELLTKTINSEAIENISVRCCDGQTLPFSGEIYDVAFSMFGLMFFPDRQRGYAEIYRTLKPGGRVLISSWASVAESPALRTMYGVVKVINPDIPEPQIELESLESPEFFHKELTEAGFKAVKIHRVTQHFPIENIESFWQGMVKGSAPIVMMKNAMSQDVWQEKEAAILDYLHTTLSAPPTSLSSDAWIGYGEK